MRPPSPHLTDPTRTIQESDASVSSDDATNMDLDLALPPPDDDVLNEQHHRIYAPPPRVAARFYRPSQARRQSSAASSRRNSFSSAHSRCSSVQHASARNAADNGQSKYVAQHLRRASFLEDRRARLADRAAHAEKVRLRAALAKAAPRGPTASEERALAAQQARERNLAEIVATCAEEVRKAKLVAELTKERREQEIAKMRAQIEERMAEAERRREELLSKNATKRSRGQSVAAARRTGDDAPSQTKEGGGEEEQEQEEEEATKPSLTEDAAAARIQGWWRGRTRRLVTLTFNALGLSVDGIRDTLFDTVVQLLAQEDVLVVTARLLRICGLREGDPASVAEMAAVRTFLSAFLILGHPNQVLSNKHDERDEAEAGAGDALGAHRLPIADLANPQLRDLVGKAKDLLVCFENILARLTASNRYTCPPALRDALPESYAVFYNAFIAWKSRDSDALIEVMLMQFVELDAIFHTVKDATDDAAAALYRQSIQDSQLMLVVRIKKLAGAERGKRLIFKAVSEARRSRRSKKKSGDTKPRVVAESSACGGGDGDDDAAATATSLVSAESHTLMMTPPATPPGGGDRKRPDDAATPKAGVLNGLLPDNRVVVHELAINREYQIPAPEYVEHKAALARPVYAKMRAAVARSDTAANFGYFMLMVGYIRDKLRRLLKPGNSMHNLIGEMLDPEMAEKQFRVGSFSYEKFFSAMGSLLPKLCAPFRDDEVRDLVQNKLGGQDLIDRVEALNGFIDVMMCDYINYLLKTAAPRLIESAAQYEAKRFDADVARGGMGLAAAEAAWRSARAKVTAEAQKRDPEGVGHGRPTHASPQPTAARFYAQMLVDVFTQPTPVRAEHIPEMLRLDGQRVADVSATVQRIVTAGAVLLQCKNLLKRDVRSPWKTEANRIMAVLEADHASAEATLQGTMAALEAGRSMPAATRGHLRALVAKVLKAGREMGRQGAEPREPVLRLLLARLRGNILARLAPGSASDKVRAANAAGERLASLGLSEFVDRVRGIADLLDKVGSVDRSAHGVWWDAVSAKVEQE
ncbi:uncharacterized protein UV8b_06110 [Ustilaginoidea virens]|uniref:IQ calmodulin-binding motif domain protein n=1 Tax=Ustilaginoidea virens TaxID=1159556 RepID=A0A8E5HV91_USTVR|nr:uncharacterized protein UV8b_06110 [Ustilaginoidea virens]QUC21869.1 hypothetical protein UV8b_06110 [Ustilaginoidea virens]